MGAFMWFMLGAWVGTAVGVVLVSLVSIGKGRNS